MAPRKKEYDDIGTIAQAIVKIVALISLVIILYIDAQNTNFESKDVELLLAGYIAGAEALSVYKKINKR